MSDNLNGVKVIGACLKKALRRRSYKLRLALSIDRPER